jgi:RNA polymerase sigma-70 factor (ECF subfamily)
MAEATTSGGDAVQRQIEALFDAYGASLYRFARAVVHRPEDAEDAVQRAFVRLLEHLRRGGDASNLKSWLFTVTANACRDELRARRRFLPWAPEHDRPVAPDDGSRDEQRRMLEEAARRLSPRDRMLIALRAQGSSYREIGAIAGIREQSVGRLLSRAVGRWQRACRLKMVTNDEYLLHGH